MAIISQNAIKTGLFVTSGPNRECVSLSIMQNKPNQTQFQMPTNPSRERKEKRVSGTFSVSRLPEMIYYCLWEIPV